MYLYLMRHADALEVGVEGIQSDTQRRLSPKGKQSTSFIAQFLLQSNIQIHAILSSPLVRAVETAALMKEGLILNSEIEETPHLAPSGSVEELCSVIGSNDHGKHLLLVGHIPYLEQLASYLLSPKVPIQIKFKKTSICCIDVTSLPPKGGAALLWMLSPDLLTIPKE